MVIPKLEDKTGSMCVCARVPRPAASLMGLFLCLNVFVGVFFKHIITCLVPLMVRGDKYMVHYIM